MNGFIRKTAVGLCLSAGFTSLTGCYCYRQLVDPAWPERYNYQARHTVQDAFAAQASNGHVLDQTIWNHFFEMDQKEKSKEPMPTDRLNPAGKQHLEYLVRRRPAPDSKIFLQMAQDLPASIPVDKIAGARTELDSKRVAAIRNYLAVLMVGRANQTDFDVLIHDVPTPSLYASPIVGQPRPTVGVIQDFYQGFKGSIPAGTGGTLTGSGGGGGGGGR